ncbi:MAG: NYN domain-containing protein [Puniceicoccales bacterium]|jgi:predicted RNA-binding protein with PIN domain|nr:NYN domain-containing protein [Puniceicoccales bacterium]
MDNAADREFHWILDGYNILYSKIPEGPKGSLEFMRHRLMAMAEKFWEKKGFPLTLVFDGTADGSPESSRWGPGVRVIFSRGNLNADGVILQLLSKDNRRVTVVTADLLLRDAVVRRGGNVMSPENFYREFRFLEQNDGSRKHGESKPGNFGRLLEEIEWER